MTEGRSEMVIKKKVREFVHAANFRIKKDAFPALEEVTRMILRRAMRFSKPYKTVRSMEVFLAVRSEEIERPDTKKKRGRRRKKG